eukprot:306916_1
MAEQKIQAVENVKIDGTTVKLSEGVVYALKSVSSGNYLDGRNGKDDDPLMTNRDPNNDPPLNWTIQKTNNGYALKGVSSGRYLDGRNGADDNPLMTARDPTNDPPLEWTFQATNGALNDAYPNVAIKGVSSGMFLDGRGGQSEPLMTKRDPMNDAYLQWVFVPMNYKLKAVLSDFDFGDLQAIEKMLDANKTLAFVDKKTIVCREVGIKAEGTFGQSVEETFSFGFSETVGVGVETEVSCGVPMLAEAKVKVSASFEFSANQQKTTSETKEFKSSYSFEPKQTGVYEMGMKVYEDTDAQLPFTSKLLIRATSNDGGKVYTGPELQGIIYFGGFNCKVVKVNDDSIEAVMSGKLKASFAVFTEVFNKRIGDIPKKKK